MNSRRSAPGESVRTRRKEEHPKRQKLLSLALATLMLILASRTTWGEVGARLVEFTVDEATRMSIDISPDGSDILCDILGDLYVVPIDGGQAKLLRGSENWDRFAQYSPDGQSIAFISFNYDGANDVDHGPLHDRGHHELWVMRSDGSEARKISTDSVGAPTWTPDGAFVVAAAPGDRGQRLMKYRVKDGSRTRFLSENWLDDSTGSLSEFGPHMTMNGVMVMYAHVRDNNSSTYVIAKTGVGAHSMTKLIQSETPVFQPVLSSDGHWMIYGSRLGHETHLRLRDMESGQDRILVELAEPDYLDRMVFPSVTPLPLFEFTGDNSAVVVAIDGQITRVDIESGRRKNVPFQAKIRKTLSDPVEASISVDSQSRWARQLRWTSFSPNGSSVAFSALGKVWLSDLGNETTIRARRLTDSNVREYTPVFSPDGKAVVYTTWTDSEFGKLKLKSLDGTFDSTLTTRPGFFNSLAWSPDGSKIAFIGSCNLSNVSALDWFGNASERNLGIYWISSEGGSCNRVADYQSGRSTVSYGRSFPPIGFSEDGTRLYYTRRDHNQLSVVMGPPSEHVLLSSGLDGSDPIEHLTLGDAAIDHIVPSPDGTKAAMIGRADIWVVDGIPARPKSPVHITTGDSVLDTHHTRSNASFLSWNGETTIHWSFANSLYRWDVGSHQPELVSVVKLPLRRGVPTGSIAFANGRILTMGNGGMLENGTVVVEGSRIADIGPSAATLVSSGAMFISIAGKTVMPGLIDTHYHAGVGNSLGIHVENIPKLASALAFGVTTILDPQAPTIDVFARSEMIEVGEAIGPRTFSTGTMIFGELSSYREFMDIGSRTDAEQIVRRLKESGAIMIKSYEQGTRRSRKLMADAARANNVGITAHLSGHPLLWISLAEDGYTAYEHFASHSSPIYSDLLGLLVHSGITLTPTLISSDRNANKIAGRTRDLQKYRYPLRLHRFGRTIDTAIVGPFDHNWIQESTAKSVAIDNIARLVTAGGMVDIGSHGNLGGLGTHWELWGVASGGLKPVAALHIVTVNGARKLGLESDLGSIEEGKLADFLVLNCNPLENIRCTADIEYVVKGGVVWHADSMTQMWPEYKPLPKPWWHSDEEWEKLKPELPEPWEGVPIADGVALEQPMIH